MSELIASAARRVELLKHMIRQLHEGTAPDQVRTQLARLLRQIPYNDVVRAEQELIRDGLPVEEVQRLCDVHTAVLRGTIDVSAAPKPPAGHPAHTFSAENQALRWEVRLLADLYAQVEALPEEADAAELLSSIRARFNALMDVEKHYLRKEYLLFPFLEKH
ncbi:MAG: DUF438 domain-containing protein, partial [Armatimonadota bacterium]|nr:DUF438 domain-containing protein [Armatimonadota bacterium]